MFDYTISVADFKRVPTFYALVFLERFYGCSIMFLVHCSVSIPTNSIRFVCLKHGYNLIFLINLNSFKYVNEHEFIVEKHRVMYS